ncbi:hypothetical protein KCV03_g1770, partial [Aureobasidium melanogenum]
MDMSPVLEYLRNGNPFLNTAAPPPIYHFQLPSWNSPAAEIIRGNNINAQQLPVIASTFQSIVPTTPASSSPAYAAMPSTASSSPCAPMAINTSGGLAATSMGLTFVVNGVTYPRIENERFKVLQQENDKLKKRNNHLKDKVRDSLSKSTTNVSQASLSNTRICPADRFVLMGLRTCLDQREHLSGQNYWTVISTPHVNILESSIDHLCRKAQKDKIAIDDRHQATEKCAYILQASHSSPQVFNISIDSETIS